MSDQDSRPPDASRSVHVGRDADRSPIVTGDGATVIGEVHIHEAPMNDPPSPTPPPTRRVEIHRLPHSGRHFVAREDELRRLDRAWDDAHEHATRTPPPARRATAGSVSPLSSDARGRSSSSIASWGLTRSG